MAGPGPGFLVNTELGASVLETIAERKLLEVALAGLMGGTIAADLIQNQLGGIDKAPDSVKRFLLSTVGNLEQDVGAPIFQSFLQSALGVNLSDQHGQEAQAVRMIERAIGFGAGIPLIIGPVSGFLETKLGHHAPKELFKALRGIPHDIGMSFFLGTTLASIFETATRGPVGEAIREQTRPERLEWPQIARLLRSHELTEVEANDRLGKAGFRDPDIELVKRLSRQLVTISELQTLHDIGWWDDQIIRDYLDQLGLEPTDRDAVMQIFAHRAATEGATSFRTIARNAYLSSYISEDTYRGLLKESGTPAEAVDLLVAGVQLERDAGRLHLTITEIKDLYEHNHIDNSEVRQRLGILGMNDADIADLLTVWADGKKVARSGIGTAKILGYLVGGVLDKKTAYDHLIANGMRQQDAQFLVDHPSTHPQTVSKPITAQTIVAAYKDDVLTIDAARALLKQINVNPTQIELLLANATAVITKGKKPKKPTKTLTETQVVDALKYGLATATWAERELETLGWAADDASLLVMIELARTDPASVQQHGWQVLT
jgi:hypothetical protein